MAGSGGRESEVAKVMVRGRGWPAARSEMVAVVHDLGWDLMAALGAAIFAGAQVVAAMPAQAGAVGEMATQLHIEPADDHYDRHEGQNR